MKTRLLSLLVVLFATTALWAHTFKSGNLYYNTLSDSTVEVIQDDSYASLTTVAIPSMVSDNSTIYTITEIGAWAFRGCAKLTSVTIPNTITSIGRSAFYACTKLSAITIPNSVTSIGESALYGTPWYNNQADGVIYINNTLYQYKGIMPSNTSITVKAGTVSICPYAFSRCTELTSITIPNSVTSIGESAFSNCMGMTSITISNSITSIEASVFFGCEKLTSIIIPNSVTSIGQGAFSGCTELTSITIPSSVTSIGGYAFEGTPWFNNQPLGVVYINNMLYAYNGTMPSNTSITVQEGTVSICPYAFNECSHLASITIPSSITSIGEFAFWYCKGLTSITIPNRVTSIGSGAFAGCWQLTSIAIPDGVTSIETKTFLDCKGLTSVSIPNSVTSIGQDAFAGCTSLASITIPSKVTSIENGAFKDCTGLTSMTICAETPPTIYSDTYKNVPTDIVVYVPCNKQNTYAMAEWWYTFGNYNETMAAMVNLKSIDDDQGTVVMKKQATCEDNTAIIEAIAKENFCFARWSDGNTDNPRTIIVTGDTTYTAEFKSNLCTITVIYDTKKGCVSGGGNYTYGTQVRLEASANSGYEFVKWSDGKTYNPYIFTATKDLTLEAEFRSTTAVENVSADTPAPRKILCNGQVLILRDGKIFTPTGVEVR